VYTDPKLFFEEAFRSLTDRPPYPWQTKLFMQCLDEEWPEMVPLPTGSGKTAVLYIWLIRLAWSIHLSDCTVPRRLAWVVNRRVVVDQVTKEAECLVKSGLAKCPAVC
jgi:CRISPR-associated endonuclease/helicase Cas3